MTTDRIIENSASVLLYCDWNPELIKPILKKVGFRFEEISAPILLGALKRHEDVFGLIEDGLAVDIATLDYDPYVVPSHTTYASFIKKDKKQTDEKL